ncbi:MAG: GNAT family N-acetyltransferase [Janthinobacterium lividum]
MHLTPRRFRPDDATAWDSFVHECLQATFLHSRRFLSYHGDRFEDASLIIESDGDCVGVFPAALNPANRLEVISHPGLTYGGMLHRGHLRGERMIRALDAMRHCYRTSGYERLVYKAVPSIYHRAPAQDDLYALFRIDASRTRCDLSSAIDLGNRLIVATRRTRGLRKSVKNGVGIVTGLDWLAPLWEVLTLNLRSKFDAEPVHSLEEIKVLAERFPENIKCVCGVVDQRVVAGVLLFETPTVAHAQYIASNESGQEFSALDLVFDFCINAAIEDEKKWFDFGTSNEEKGKVLNAGLYEFKSNFGGGGVAHEFYTLDLRGAPDEH